MPTLAAVGIAISRSVYGSDVGSRGAEFIQIVSQAVSAAKADVPNAELIVVVAPEYFFSLINPYGQRIGSSRSDINPVPQSAKMGYYSDIESASKAHPSVLIISGTILYNKNKGIINKKKVGLNVCPVAIGGKIKHKIYKEQDDETVKLSDGDAVFESKKNRSDPVFTESGIKFSIDICADRGRARKIASEVDVHIMVSAGSAPHSGPKAKYVLHCDLTGGGAPNTSGIAVAKDSKLINMTAKTVDKPVARINGVILNVHALEV